MRFTDSVDRWALWTPFRQFEMSTSPILKPVVRGIVGTLPALATRARAHRCYLDPRAVNTMTYAQR